MSTWLTGGAIFGTGLAVLALTYWAAVKRGQLEERARQAEKDRADDRKAATELLRHDTVDDVADRMQSGRF